MRDFALSYPNSAKTRFRPRIATVLSPKLPGAAGKPATLGLSVPTCCTSFRRRRLAFSRLNPVARLPLPEVVLVAKDPAGLTSALFLEDCSSVGFDISPNRLLRKGLKQIFRVEMASDLCIAGRPVEKQRGACGFT